MYIENEAGYFGLLEEYYELPMKCVCERCYCNPNMQQVAEVAVPLYKESVTVSPKIY